MLLGRALRKSSLCAEEGGAHAWWKQWWCSMCYLICCSIILDVHTEPASAAGAAITGD